MYRNPYKFDIGDLVSYSPHADPGSHPQLPILSQGIITKKRRQSYYVEARPIKCVEEDQYLVVFGEGAGHWVPCDDLDKSQKTAWTWQDERHEES